MAYYLAAAAGSLFGAMHDPVRWLVLFAALAMRGLGWPAVIAFLSLSFGLHLWGVESYRDEAWLASWQPNHVAFMAALWAGFYLIFMSLAIYLLRITGLGREPKLHKQG